ncbi:hypothetical protein K8R66_00205 [bacterium]|nr:hypothetical protein [bacterium]
MKKKIVYIVIFILIIFIFAFLIYNIFFGGREKIEPEPIVGETEPGTLPGIGEGEPTVIGEELEKLEPGELSPREKESITEKAIGGFTKSEAISERAIKMENIGSDNSITYYDERNEQFYKINNNGEVSRLSDSKFYSVKNVVWSPTKNQAIIEYPDSRKILYDFDKDEYIASFPKETQDFSFSKTGGRLSYEWIGDYKDQNYLVVSNADSSNFKFIRPIADQAKNIDTVWSPDSQVLGTFRKQYDGQRQEVFFLNEDRKNINALLVDGINFEGKWDRDGDRLLYSVDRYKDKFIPTLYAANGQTDKLGSGKRDLNLHTWIDKCDFSQKNGDLVYCAVPDYLPDGSGLYPEFAEGIPYSIYSIDMKTGRSSQIAIPVVNNQRVGIEKVYVNKGDKKIYYTNSGDNRLYGIDL